MRFLKQGLALAVVGAGLAAFPGVSAQAVTPVATVAPGDNLVNQMRNEARGSVTFSAEPSTGKVGFARSGSGGDLLPSVEAGSSSTAATKARDYLDKYATAFGARPAELVQTDLTDDLGGWTVSYQQRFHGLDVFGGIVRAHLDRDGDLTAVNGFAAPALSISTTPRLSAAQAVQRAIAFVRSSPTEAATGSAEPQATLRASKNDLEIYRTGAIKGDVGSNVLAYVTELTDGADVREKVFVDAQSGKVINRYSMTDGALNRELREASANDGGTPDDPSDDTVDFTTVYQEGDPIPGNLNDDEVNLIKSSGESYWFFHNAFNRDSYDNAGAKRITVNNDPRIACPNANWNGQTTNYCDGVTSDDVVAHEWGHAYTEYTWGGIYQWQSGALNEAYSDIWGETLDLINHREDEGEGDISAKRPVGLCSTHSPAIPLVTIDSPATISGPCATGGYLGPQVLTPVSTNVVLGLDEANADGPTTNDGCTAFTNAAAVAGKIAMVDRGTCAFVTKAANAKAAGVAALIIGNRDNSPVSFSSPDQTLPLTVSIGLDKRESIKSALAAGNPVTATISDSGGQRHDSYRWLIGEKSDAFGGAIRDMWVPTCYGDPGKVSDVEYKCSTDDQGGVHGNSGVANHGYALLVDGGTYNGVAVKGIGLDKAANIYYRAMTDYQTPITDFSDHADSLAAACKDLTGKSIKELSTAPNDVTAAQNKITSVDCESVDQMAAAVELRVAPVQCDFKPQLDPNTPSVCGDGFGARTVFSDDFETTGISAWTQGASSVYGGPTRPWTTSTELPEGNLPAGDTTAAFGPAPDLGQCTQDTQDFSSVNTITSPPIVVGAVGDAAPRLSFDHNIQTELGFDGGTVLLSVNGGTFAVVPAAAYTFNGPSVLATAAAGSTDPLAGQPGFTGTDGGKIKSDWGTSIIDLSAAGVTPGDTIAIRYAIGRDGCGGVNGWWVDNVKVATCKQLTATTVTGAQSPTTSSYGKASKVVVHVAGGTPAPTGRATVMEGTKTLGSAALSGGTASVPLPANLSVGTHSLRVVYSGDSTYAGSTTTAKAKVVKATSTTSTKARSYAVRQGKPVVLTSTVRASGVVPAGTLTIKSGGVKVGSGVLKNGVVTITITKRLPKGKRNFNVIYPGSATVAGSSRLITIKIT